MTEIDEAEPWVNAYLEANRQIARYEEIKKQARARIEAALGESKSGTVAGVERVRIKSVAGKLDGSRLREAHPDIYHAFTNPATTRFEVVPDDA